MKPVNTKSMFALLTKTMEQLDKDEIDVFKATAQAKLIDSAGRMLNYELKRAACMMNKDFRLEHRNLEEENFDSLPE